MQRSTIIGLFLFVLTSLQMKAQPPAGHYAKVNGVNMYYEIHGTGKPLVLIHGGGSTIQSSYGRILPELAKTHQVIAIEEQAHGHTLDIDRPVSFENTADDVAALLKHLHIAKADMMGFSNGGTTTLQIAIRHPELVNKMILASTLTKRSGMPPGFFDGFDGVTLDVMPEALKAAYLAANPDPKGLQTMFNRDVARMKAFKDIPDTAIKAIQAPALIVNGATEIVLPDHALELSRLLPHARLLIMPGGHGEYMGEVEFRNDQTKMPSVLVTMMEEFLQQ
jgi:pimeloyl-ACP methyl ester carboxylesterase